ncbi:type 1 fimbrial protein [Stenotrophomonas maltophilia]|uniref:fimbrial protein n=1 Tax=Stenotrophomonas maltophilia TaxID=40324 RepID=UPI0010760E78|nr:fimbrial protein [Stenotrophomonas maltophilia]TFZ44670.1 type 1 fimbrial protein [Stenotrophomonas maltophilia]
MKHTLFSFALVASTFLTSYAASASDGTITFNGSVTDTTCKVNGGTAGDFTVTLPSIQATALPSAGSTAATTGFKITLSDCQGAATKVSTYFEDGGMVDVATGKLKLDAGGAGNVQIGLLKADGVTPIKLGQGIVGQDVVPVEISNAGAVLSYFAQYARITGDVVTPGAANTRVVYSLNYQ